MDKYLNEMINIGLQEYESRAYYVLLTQGNLTAKEISKKAEIPQPKVYSILSNLIKKGFCSRVPGKNKLYKAIQPKIAFSLMKSEIEERQNKLENVVDHLEKLYVSENNKTIDDYIEILTNNQQIHERYLSWKSNSKKEMICFVKPPYAHEGDKVKLKSQEKSAEEKIRKGLTSKAIYELPKSDDSFLFSHIELSIANGEKAKVIDELPLKLYVFDERYVLMALNNPINNFNKLTMIAIEHPDLAKASKMLFEHIWEKAITYEEYKTTKENRRK